jgi:hypothetical protein
VAGGSCGLDDNPNWVTFTEDDSYTASIWARSGHSWGHAEAACAGVCGWLATGDGHQDVGADLAGSR